MNNNNSCNSSHVHNNSSIITTATTTTKDVHVDDDDEVMLPGFRFHPTDEELVGFYLRRKVEKKPIVIELIKQIDIYKYDPWDLPKISSMADKEGYFFCKRGRKYRNSIRPNRVTGSGFWKATGIDKPVYSSSPSSSSTSDAHGYTQSHHHYGYHQNNSKIIGLKKTLVYYRGSAGKGTKTDWMMHEFRLPGNNNNDNNGNNNIGICPPEMNNNDKSNPTVHEAEVWTICRIFKRNVSHRKYTPPSSDLRQSSSALSSSNKRSNININNNNHHHHHLNNNNNNNNHNNNSYISFEAPLFHHHHRQIDKKPNFDNQVIMMDDRSSYPSVTLQQQTMRSTVAQLINPSVGVGPLSSPPTSFINNYHSYFGNNNDYNHMFIGNNYENNWDELSSVVDFSFHNSSLM